ncbi:GNAT family N-acetyltransferase [Streptomyces beijiangensis]|uniref:GNAT family N-acetyltransferase n=1 Tax=Streptomyces beijiangensis TaxID=163361 RepID=A0A939FF79_9ACTN|nr:GNAT family N-acetyltransferase [Streptomyces beijiangensis]MBO0517588.1 GNAT family N-acetyltransferase [Streptomyces beijiangensis]
MTAIPYVRRARPADLARIGELIAEHAAYEQATPPPEGSLERLGAALFDLPDEPRIRCLVAEGPEGEIVGYATCAPEFSTWQGREYLHMDCLYLCPGQRGLGLGARLMEAVVAEARALGIGEVQWQTPEWNEGAIRFYDRTGARSSRKLRYSVTAPPV